MKFSFYAAAAALAIGLVGAPASAQTSDRSASEDVSTSAGTFIVCRDAGRYPASCGGTQTGEPQERNPGAVVWWIHHVIKLPTGRLLKMSPHFEPGFFRGIVEQDGRVFMTTMAGHTGRLFRYEPSIGEFKEVYHGSYFINLSTEQKPGPYFTVDSDDGHSDFKGLLRVTSDNEVRVYKYDGIDQKKWVEKIEPQGDGRLKLLHAFESCKIARLADGKTDCPPSSVTFFDPKTSTFSES